MNDLEGLYIQIASTNRDDLFEDGTMDALRESAKRVGYNGSEMDRGNFAPLVEEGAFSHTYW